MATAQTTKQKVLYMNVIRTNRTTTARLESAEDYLGPVYNMETQTMFINGTWRSKSSIAEIRFEIREEEVTDGIEDMDDVEASTPSATYDLSGRKVEERSTKHGLYIKGGKKIVK